MLRRVFDALRGKTVFPFSKRALLTDSMQVGHKFRNEGRVGKIDRQMRWRQLRNFWHDLTAPQAAHNGPAIFIVQ